MKICDAISLYDLQHMRKDWRGVPDLDDLQYKLIESYKDMSITEFELFLIATKLQSISFSTHEIKESLEYR